MQACGGAAMMGSLQLQQPLKFKANRPIFPFKGFGMKLKSVKPCKAQLESVLEKTSIVDHGLSEADPEVRAIVNKEKERQFKSLELIASENFTPRAVMEAVGYCLTNMYSEGLPSKMYYGGNEYIDELEILCQKRALTVFRLDENKWALMCNRCRVLQAMMDLLRKPRYLSKP